MALFPDPDLMTVHIAGDPDEEGWQACVRCGCLLNEFGEGHWAVAARVGVNDAYNPRVMTVRLDDYPKQVECCGLLT